VPIAPARVAEAAELAGRIEHFTVLVDGEVAVAELAACAEARGVTFPVMLKVDCGYHRAGVDPDSAAAVALAARIAGSRGLELCGVLTHAGHAYRCRDAAEITTVAEQERSVTVAFAERLRGAGIAVPEVSIGSTPTIALAGDLSGVTEVRPGNYAFFDAFQAAIGACALDDAAFLVAATVIGSHPERGVALLDAGALALSKDEGPRHADPECGYGVLLDPAARRPLAGVRLTALSQEHGHVCGAAAAIAALPVGARVLVVPNHSCLAAALFDRYAVARGAEVVAEWHPVRGW